MAIPYKASDCLGIYENEDEWFVKSLIPEGFTILYGPRSAGKTFVALSIAHALASKKPWLGKFDVPSQEGVLYIWGEGKPDKRVNALAEVHGPEALNDITIYPASVDFTDEAAVEKLIDDLHAVRHQVTFIIIDNYAACTTGTENDDATAKAFLAGVHHLREELFAGAGVLLLHHALDKEAKEMRGSKVLLNRADAALNLVADANGQMTLRPGRNPRDHAAFAPVRLKRREVKIATDKNETSSFVIELVGSDDVDDRAGGAEPQLAERSGPRKVRRVSNAQKLKDTLLALGGRADEPTVRDQSGIPKGSWFAAKTAAIDKSLIREENGDLVLNAA